MKLFVTGIAGAAALKLAQKAEVATSTEVTGFSDTLRKIGKTCAILLDEIDEEMYNKKKTYTQEQCNSKHTIKVSQELIAAHNVRLNEIKTEQDNIQNTETTTEKMDLENAMTDLVNKKSAAQQKHNAFLTENARQHDVAEKDIAALDTAVERISSLAAAQHGGEFTPEEVNRQAGSGSGPGPNADGSGSGSGPPPVMLDMSAGMQQKIVKSNVALTDVMMSMDIDVFDQQKMQSLISMGNEPVPTHHLEAVKTILMDLNIKTAERKEDIEAEFDSTQASFEDNEDLLNQAIGKIAKAQADRSVELANKEKLKLALDEEDKQLNQEIVEADDAIALAETKADQSEKFWSKEKEILTADKSGLTQAIETISTFQTNRNSFLQTSAPGGSFESRMAKSGNAFEMLFQAAQKLQDTKKTQIAQLKTDEEQCQKELAKQALNSLAAGSDMDQQGDQIHQNHEQFHNNRDVIDENRREINRLIKEIAENAKEKQDTHDGHALDQKFEKEEHDTMMSIKEQLESSQNAKSKTRGNLKPVITLVESMMSESQQKTARSQNKQDADNAYYSKLDMDLNLEKTTATGILDGKVGENKGLLSTAQELNNGIATLKTKQLDTSIAFYNKEWRRCQTFREREGITKTLDHEIKGLESAKRALNEIRNKNPTGPSTPPGVFPQL